MIEIVFTPTAEDYVAVQRAMYARQLRSRRTVVRIGLLLVICVAVLMALALFIGDGIMMALLVGTGGVAGGVVALAGVVFVNWLWLPRHSRRLFAQQRTLHHEHRTTFDERGMRQRSVRADMTLPWHDLPYWHLGCDVLLLYSNDHLAYFIPRRAFAGDQLTATITLLEGSGIPRR